MLTHNIDLLRLLEGQYKNCFKLYLFNNTDGGENGFIELGAKEQDMLINIDKLLCTFRTDIYKDIKNIDLYLVSMIPFMRGYATIINDEDAKEELTQLMHGYKNRKINLARNYRKLFGNSRGELAQDTQNIIPHMYELMVEDILAMEVDNDEIVDKTKYPLLNRTLQHSYTYLYLRLIVEKELAEIYGVDTQKNQQLGQIIAEAFPNLEDSGDIKNRVMLTTKKTLLNEFNHFEGNMSIFQPAIDITDQMLEKEKKDILEFINGLKSKCS